MSTKNFQIVGTTAIYDGVINAYRIIEAGRAAQRLAATENIDSFEVTIPNSEFAESGAYAELKAKGLRILRSSDGGTTVGYRFVRTVSIAVEVAERPQPTVPAPIDLAHRRVV